MYFNGLQGGNYSNNSSEVRFELVSLANSNQFVNWAESFLLIPLQLSVSGVTAGNVAGGLSALPENAFALSLKNGYQHIIDSLLITINDNPVNQPCQGCNIPNTFKMYSMSADDRKTLGSMLNFFVDTGDSIRYFPNPAVYYTGTLDIASMTAGGIITFTAIATPLKIGQQFVYLGTTYTIQADTIAASTTVQVFPRPNGALGTAVTVQISTPLSLSSGGLGECNNSISKATGFNPRDGYQAINGLINQGRVQRMTDTSYDPTTAGNPVSTYFQSATAAGQLFKNHVVTNSATTIVYNIFATIPMATLNDFFDKLPIARGLNVRLNLYLNTNECNNFSLFFSFLKVYFTYRYLTMSEMKLIYIYLFIFFFQREKERKKESTVLNMKNRATVGNVYNQHAVISIRQQ